MKTRATHLLVALAAAFVLSACSSDSPAGRKDAVATVSLPDGGTLYLVAGPSGSAQDLYRIRGDGRSEPERLTAMQPGRDLSALTAGSGQVIVSEASEGTDKIARLVGGRLERLIDDRVFTPSLSDDGRLAYVRLHEEVKRPNEDFVVVRDLDAGEERTVYQQSGKSVSYPAWGPSGLLGVVEKDPPLYRQARVVLIPADGSTRSIELGDRPSTALIGSQQATQFIVVDYGPPPSGFLLDPVSGQRQDLAPGWLPLAWSPEGTSILVADDRRLGLIRPPDLAQVQQIGTFPEPVWQADWRQARSDRDSGDGESTGPSRRRPQ
ncbi:MAG: hypothetical protein ACT4PX_10995 [Actinomycetota bacterium]